MAIIRSGWVLPPRTVMAFDSATVSGCDQLVVGPTHARGGTLDLLMTDVPDLFVPDSKLTFEKHLRLVSRAASQRLGILIKS